MGILIWVGWNIFLAVIPVAAAWLLYRTVESYRQRGKRAPWPLLLVLGVIWLAFLPNTCYLLTEWRHFLSLATLVGWRDNGSVGPLVKLYLAKQALFFIFFSGAGVVCFTLAIRPIEKLLQRTRLNLVLLAVPFFFLISLGVYMGLIIRLNSWDIVTRPMGVLEVAFNALASPLLLKAIVIFGALLWLMYEIVDIWVDGLLLHQARWRRFFAPKGAS